MNFILHFLRCKYEMNYKKWPSHSQWIGMYKQSLNNVFITKKLRQKQLKEAHQVNTESCPRARAYYQARQRPPLLQQPCKTSTAWQGLTQYNRPHGLGKETAPQSQPEGGKQSERLLKPLHIPWPLLRSGSFLQASPAGCLLRFLLSSAFVLLFSWFLLPSLPQRRCIYCTSCFACPHIPNGELLSQTGVTQAVSPHNQAYCDIPWHSCSEHNTYLILPLAWLIWRNLFSQCLTGVSGLSLNALRLEFECAIQRRGGSISRTKAGNAAWKRLCSQVSLHNNIITWSFNLGKKEKASPDKALKKNRTDEGGE